MFDFILFLLGMVPAIVWVVLGLTVLVLVQFLWGWRATLAAAISLLPVLGYLWGRKRQAEIDQARRDRAALDHVIIRRDVEEDVKDLGSQDVANELRRWNRVED